MKVTQVASPLPGEHLAATSPPSCPGADAGWRARLSFWAGRALTADALELEQQNRAGRLAWRGRVATPGVVAGLELALEVPTPLPAELRRAGYVVHLTAGCGLGADGEDIVVPRPLSVPLDQIPVHYVRIDGRGGEPAESAPAGATAGQMVDAGGFAFAADTFDKTHDPWAAVLVLCPSEFRTFAGVDPESPCALDPSRDAFADERRVDACVLRLCQLPARWEALPRLADRSGPGWRNRLAAFYLEQETAADARLFMCAQEAEPGEADWEVLLRPRGIFPWDVLGVPIALMASEQATDTARKYFLDRAAVARPGGRARSRTRPALHVVNTATALTAPGAGSPLLWRARVDQFAEHLRQFPTTTEAEINELAARFRFLPPVGFLPRGVLDLLTTSQANALPAVPSQPPDRAGTNHLFPAAWSVEAVPIALEDIGCALAASAPLSPYDCADGAKDWVRILVPLPQRVFDPRLLVVEQEDPIFANTLGRFVETRQDWRQREDFVRGRMETLAAALDGPTPDVAAPELEAGLPAEASAEAGQLEVEPVEAIDTLGFSAAWLSPEPTRLACDLTVTFAAPHRVTSGATLFVLIRADADAIPDRLDAAWLTASGEVPCRWAEMPEAPLEQTNDAGEPQATRLWRRLSVNASDLGFDARPVTGLRLHVENGRIAIASAGQLTGETKAGLQAIETWWRAEDAEPVPRFAGRAWKKIGGDRLLAPFEKPYVPAFPDNRSLLERLGDIEAALNPAGIVPRAVALSVAADGLERALAELEAEANEADDFIDAHFTRAQTNLYRIRKLVLGQSAAQKLLVNPAIATIAEQETATASADQLASFLESAKGRVVAAADVNVALAGAAATPRAATGVRRAGIADVKLNAFLSSDAAAERLSSSVRTDEAVFGERKAERSTSLKDVLGERPEAGPTLPPRGLSIGQRFKEPAATENLSYARSALLTLVNQLPSLRMPLVGCTIRSIDQASDVSLLALQGRAVPPANAAAGVTSETTRQEAVSRLFTVAPLPADGQTDEAQVTLAALDFTEVQSALLRTIERAVLDRRAVIAAGTKTNEIVAAERDLAGARLVTIRGALAEARQDVSVARALRQEERQRVNAINDRRDELIRDEVTFLAYVRPRAVELTARDAQYWKVEGAASQGTLPVCGQRHDDPPAELDAYLQLFRQAPARWFTTTSPLIKKLDTPEKLVSLLEATRASAASFAKFDTSTLVVASAKPVQATVVGAGALLAGFRAQASAVAVADRKSASWAELHSDALKFAAVGDLAEGRHGSRDVSAAATAQLEQLGQVATCMHAGFAAAPPAMRLAWVERFSQFDRPASFRDLTVLPQFDRLDRAARRLLQEQADWLFGRLTVTEAGALSLVNDLVRLCLLLASHAPVNRIIAGHIPRPLPVQPGIRIPIHPVNPELVRVGMEFHVWQASRLVASGLVEDLRDREVSARVDTVDASTRTLDTSMRVQFIPAALGIGSVVR